MINLDVSNATASKTEDFVVPHMLIDLGHGWTKGLGIDKTDTFFGPSKFPSDLREMSLPKYTVSDRQSVLIEIISSTNKDIQGIKLIGQNARGTVQSLSAGKQNKYSAAIAPWLLFAMMGLVIPRGKGIKKFSFNSSLKRLFVLLPNTQSQVNSTEFKSAIAGKHVIRISRQGDRMGTMETMEGEIVIDGGQVALCPEGLMAFDYCKHKEILEDLPRTSRVIILNLGHNTAIFSLLASDGSLEKRQIFPRAGCLALIDSICESEEMCELIGGETPNKDLVAEGIIDRSDNSRTAFYGRPQRGLNFYEIYNTALEQWQHNINRLFPEFVDAATAATVEKVIAVGKPVELFKLEYLPKSYQFLEFPNECDLQFIDLEGLYYHLASKTNPKGEPANLLA